jgi:hypothetical protein
MSVAALFTHLFTVMARAGKRIEPMIRAALAFLLASVLSANAGSLTITYKNTAGTTTFAPTATISDADAATFVSWCSAHYASTPGSGTAAGCFNIYANDIFNQLKLAVQAAAQTTAAQNAANAVVPITVTPAQ